MAGKPGETQHHTGEYLQMRKAVWGTLLASLLLPPSPPPQGINLSDEAYFLQWVLQACLKKFTQLPGIVWYLFILSSPALTTTAAKSKRQLGATCAYSQRGGWSSELLVWPRVLAARTTHTLWSLLLRGQCCTAAGEATSTPFLFLLRQCLEHLELLPPAPPGLSSLHKFGVPAVPEVVGAGGDRGLGGSVLEGSMGAHPSR